MLKAFNRFFDSIDLLCERLGSIHIYVDRYFPSTRKCFACGFVMPHLSPRIRSWICTSCGDEHDRDYNAAKNILAEGVRIIGGTVTMTGAEASVANAGFSLSAGLRSPYITAASPKRGAEGARA